MAESESSAPKICPLLSGVVTIRETEHCLKRMFCEGDGCEFWSEKQKVCSFVRKVEYESLLEKIIQEKS